MQRLKTKITELQEEKIQIKAMVEKDFMAFEQNLVELTAQKEVRFVRCYASGSKHIIDKNDTRNASDLYVNMPMYLIVVVFFHALLFFSVCPSRLLSLFLPNRDCKKSRTEKFLSSLDRHVKCKNC